VKELKMLHSVQGTKTLRAYYVCHMKDGT
jgi:hypothetical protein